MNQTRLILLIAASTFSVCPLLSQNPVPKTSFEVISIKPTLPGNSPRGGGPRGDRFSMTGATLKMLLQSAYQRSTPGTASDFQVIGGPAWIDDDRYDVDAKADCSGRPISRDQFQLMVQSLLEDRFQLKAHLEPREVPIYHLVVGKDGPKLKASPDQSPVTPPGANSQFLCAPPPTDRPPTAPRTTPFDPTKMRGFLSMQYAPGSATATGNAVAISTLLTVLRLEAGRPIVDKTNLQGLYDFKLRFSPERMSNPYAPGTRGALVAGPGGPIADPTAAADPVPTLSTAIQEQLGLKFESTKGEIHVLVIDSAQKPTAN